VPRPTKPGKKQNYQEELMEYQVTAKEAYEHLRRVAKLSLPHSFDASWDAHNRRLHFETFTDKSLTIMTDFSATFNCKPQNQLLCAIPAHAILCVAVVSHSPANVLLDNGKLKRVIQNDVIFVWAETTKNSGDILKNDNFFHINLMKWIINHYKNDRKLPFTELDLFTDQCSPQYKCGKNCYALTELVREFPFLTSIRHNYAPTACFKTPVDGAGTHTIHITQHLT
jgi:hypothetical protein